MIIGVVAAISAAFSWTFACFIWRSETIFFSVTQINFVKNFLAALLFLPVLISIDWLSQIKFITILCLSGAIGIAWGDSLYLAALKRIGTRRTLTVEAFSPILANTLGSLFLGETPSSNALIGASVLTFSLVLIVQQQRIQLDILNEEINSNFKGYAYAFLSILLAVCAAILSRFVLKNSSLSPIQSAEVRLIGSLFVLLPIVKTGIFESLNKASQNSKIKLFSATIVGTNFGIFLQQTAYKMLPVGIASTLLCSSPVISLLFARFEGEKVKLSTFFIAITAFLGVAIALL